MSRREGVQTASEGEGMRRGMADVEIDMHAGSGDGTFKEQETRNETAVSLR